MKTPNAKGILNLNFRDLPDPPVSPKTPIDGVKYLNSIIKFQGDQNSRFANSYTLNGFDIYKLINLNQNAVTICIYNGLVKDQDGNDRKVFVVFPVKYSNGDYAIIESQNDDPHYLYYDERSLCQEKCQFDVETTPALHGTWISFQNGLDMVQAYDDQIVIYYKVRGYLIERETLDRVVLSEAGSVKFHMRVYRTLDLSYNDESDQHGILVSLVHQTTYTNTNNYHFHVLNHKSLCPKRCDVLKYEGQE